MVDEIVPTGPRGAVRGSNEPNRGPIRTAGENPDPRDTSPTASAEPERDSDGVPKFGGGGVKVRAIRAFWPSEQPDNDRLNREARDNGTPPIHREHVVREGEVAEIPNDHAMDLLEKGVVERVKD
jgi:hypothetical protein